MCMCVMIINVITDDRINKLITKPVMDRMTVLLYSVILFYYDNRG
jgi:hypothetical protein